MDFLFYRRKLSFTIQYFQCKLVAACLTGAQDDDIACLPLCDPATGIGLSLIHIFGFADGIRRAEGGSCLCK